MSAPRPPATAVRRLGWVPGLLGVVAGALFLVRLVLVGDVDAKGLGLAIGGALCLLLFAWLDEAEDGAPEATGPLRLSVGALAFALLTIVTAVGAYALARTYDRVWDLTTVQRYALSDHARARLAALPADVELTAFFPWGSAELRGFQDLATQLEAASPRIHIQLTDRRRDPALAEQLQVAELPISIVARRGDRREVLAERRDETAVVNAIVRVASDAERRVCWSTGHGEAEPDRDNDPRAMSAAVLALEGAQVQVQKVNLLQGDPDPACEVLVVAAPRDDLSPEELDTLGRYVARGGRALLLVEPGRAPAFAASLGRFGVDAADGVLVDPDPSRRLGQVDAPVVMLFDHELWRPSPLANGVGGAVVLGVARAIVPRDGIAGLRAHALLFTSAAAWTEPTPPDVAPPARDPGDPAGEQPVVVAIEVDDGAAVLADPAARPGARLVIIGDATFATNELIGFGSNQELFLAAITWLLGADDELADRADPAIAALEMTAAERAWWALLALLVTPGVPVVVAVQRWWARRRG